MSHEPERGRTLSVKLPPRLNRALQRVADREANAPSTIARRYIAAGLALEAQRERVDASFETDAAHD